MCGRFLSLSSPDALAERFGVDEVRTEALARRYNVAPSTDVYAVIEHEGRRRLGSLRWGFVPRWAKQLRGTPQPINARIETLASSRMFADSFARRRCIVPADGFYEWQDRGDGPKQPYHLASADGAPLAFGSIWTAWRDPAIEDPEPVFSTAIVTTAATGDSARIHARLPLILPEQLWAAWLAADAQDAPHLLAATAALAPPALVATPITTRVNSVRNDGPELLEPDQVDARGPD